METSIQVPHLTMSQQHKLISRRTLDGPLFCSFDLVSFKIFLHIPISYYTVEDSVYIICS